MCFADPPTKDPKDYKSGEDYRKPRKEFLDLLNRRLVERKVL
jgi:hypothetical protein